MLREHLKSKDNNEFGFTLIELLVVILIIGVLASIAIPAFLNQRQRANDATVISDVRNVSMVLESEMIGKPHGYVVQWTSNTSGDIRLGLVDNRGDHLSQNGILHRVSPGVTVRVWTSDGAPGTYSIRGWHVNGKEYKNETVGTGPNNGGYYFHSYNK